MTTSEATTKAIELLPKHTIICSEHYITTPFGDTRMEQMECVISIYQLPEVEARQAFTAPSFPACLDQIRAIQNETTKQ